MSWDGRIRADARHLPIADNCVQCVVTSPPYWGLRDYGTTGQIGLEATPALYVASMLEVFREIWRVLADRGTVWLNLGDSYNAYNGGAGPSSALSRGAATTERPQLESGYGLRTKTLKPKDMCGIPWSVAKALQSPQYLGRIASELDRVWLAATIDAEGSICGFTHERKDDGAIRTGIHITITNTNRPLLDNAFRIWPTSREDHNLHGKGHLGLADCYRWIAHNVDDKSELIREIYPYLIAKKQQALLAWNFLEMSKDAKRLARTTESESIKERRAWIVDALSKLNHFQSVDTPDWCKEPPSLFTDGWYLRRDIIWHKPNPMPESVTDRPTSSHEYIFLLTKSAKYYYDSEAIKEPSICGDPRKPYAPGQVDARGNGHDRNGGKIRPSVLRGGFNGKTEALADEGRNAFRAVEDWRNKRSVWTISTRPYPEAHYATFPEDIPEICIKAGSKPGDLILDPFCGSGTVGRVAERLSRCWIGCDLGYQELQEKRMENLQKEFVL